MRFVYVEIDLNMSNILNDRILLLKVFERYVK